MISVAMEVGRQSEFGFQQPGPSGEPWDAHLLAAVHSPQPSGTAANVANQGSLGWSLILVSTRQVSLLKTFFFG